MTIQFSKANGKLAHIAEWANVKKSQIFSFDLLSGHTCPAANECLAKVYEQDGTRVLVPGDNALFVCYAAKAERQYKNTFAMRKNNWQSLVGLTSDEILEVLEYHMPKNAKVIRIHSAGDFFSKAYFKAWVKLAQNHPDIMFFGYTKILTYSRIVQNLDMPNFSIAYSHGGLMDKHIVPSDLVSYVVTSTWVLNEDGTATSPDGTTVPVACTADKSTAHLDYVAIVQKSGSFGLMLH